MKFVTFCTKGLEEIVTEEIQEVFPKAKILTKADKRIVFDISQIPQIYELLTSLRTVDDIGLLVEEATIKTTDDVLTSIEKLDLSFYRDQLSQFRIVNPLTFSLTLSIAKNPNIKPSDLQEKLVIHLKTKYNWQLTEDDHTNFDLRIFVDHISMIVSMRLTNQSLHHRKYKMVQQDGSLRPTVAAAMVRLAIMSKENLKIIDNFCGSGTILCEALSKKCHIFGGDISQESVKKTYQNLFSLKYKKEAIKRLNATDTHFENSVFDAAISNLPWNKQIKVESITTLYRDTLQEYKRIVKPLGTICLLVHKPELLIKHAKEIFPGTKINEYKIGLLGQTPTIVLIQRSN